MKMTWGVIPAILPFNAILKPEKKNVGKEVSCNPYQKKEPHWVLQVKF
jgi:hypothetical protein